jgi:hypothetical protein
MVKLLDRPEPVRLSQPREKPKAPPAPRELAWEKILPRLPQTRERELVRELELRRNANGE